MSSSDSANQLRQEREKILSDVHRMQNELKTHQKSITDLEPMIAVLKKGDKVDSIFHAQFMEARAQVEKLKKQSDNLIKSVGAVLHDHPRDQMQTPNDSRQPEQRRPGWFFDEVTATPWPEQDHAEPQVEPGSFFPDLPKEEDFGQLGELTLDEYVNNPATSKRPGISSEGWPWH